MYRLLYIYTQAQNFYRENRHRFNSNHISLWLEARCKVDPLDCIPLYGVLAKYWWCCEWSVRGKDVDKRGRLVADQTLLLMVNSFSLPVYWCLYHTIPSAFLLPLYIRHIDDSSSVTFCLSSFSVHSLVCEVHVCYVGKPKTLKTI